MSENQALSSTQNPSVMHWGHLSLDVLDVFLRTDGQTSASAKPIVSAYESYANLTPDPTSERFKEQTLSEMLTSIKNMDRTNRMNIFKQSNMSSLTVLLEILIKQSIERTSDLTAIKADPARINTVRLAIESKGFIPKFIDLIILELFGLDLHATRKEEEMIKRKDAAKQAAKKADKPTKKHLPLIFNAGNRSIQLFPAASKGSVWAIHFAVASIILLFLAVVSITFMTGYSPSIDDNCSALVSNGYTNKTLPGLCVANSNFKSQSLIALVIAAIAAGYALFSGIKLVRILAHNNYANTNNTFELSHHTITRDLNS